MEVSETSPILAENVPAPYHSINSRQSGVSFHGLTYTVTKGLCKKTEKIILNDVSGVMLPGLNAIMGPTGSGKTSLLDILAGRKSKKGLQGTVLINGVEQPRNFKCTSGYVVQDSMVMGTLTVRENLYFSAALRLPLSVSWDQKKRRIKRIISELGLEDCADTRVGTEYRRGISGGERKRTDIGMELVIEPNVLFLDEPTTGLDAFTAVSTVQLLKDLSNTGNRIIIMSIHQPRYSIYRLFDTLTLLSKGNMIYHGMTKDSLDYFERLGLHCDDHDNPADFLLDITTNSERKSRPIAGSASTEQRPTGSSDLAEAYYRSAERKATISQCDQICNSRPDLSNGVKYRVFSSTMYNTNALWQLFVVLIRSTVNVARNPKTSVLQYIITVIFGLIVGAIYFKLDTGQNGYQNRVGVIFFIVMNQIFGNLSAVDLFVQQKALFIHENASGYYRVSAYFIAKVVCDLVSTRLFPLCFFSVIVYFMLGFQLDVEKFFIFFMTLFLTAFSASAIAFWVSAGVRITGVGNLLIALCFVFQMLFGGFLITLDSLPVYFRWLQYTSIFRYAVEALVVNEVEGLEFNQTVHGETGLVNGTEILKLQGFKTSWLWYDQIGLAGLCVVFLTLGYITLRAIKKEK